MRHYRVRQKLAMKDKSDKYTEVEIFLLKSTQETLYLYTLQISEICRACCLYRLDEGITEGTVIELHYLGLRLSASIW